MTFKNDEKEQYFKALKEQDCRICEWWLLVCTSLAHDLEDKLIGANFPCKEFRPVSFGDYVNRDPLP